MKDEVFNQRVKSAWRRYDEGTFITMEKEEFLKELESW